MSGECDECGEHSIECACLAIKELERVERHLKSLTQEEWETALVKGIVSRGWVNDRDDEITLGFSFYTALNEHWIKDYDKRSRSFIHYNGNQRVSLVSTKVKNES